MSNFPFPGPYPQPFPQPYPGAQPCEVVTRGGETVGEVFNTLGLGSENFTVAREIKVRGNQQVCYDGTGICVTTFDGQSVANVIRELERRSSNTISNPYQVVQRLRVYGGQTIVNPNCGQPFPPAPCNDRVRNGETVGELINRLRYTGEPLALVRNLYLIPGQPVNVPGCRPFPPPVPPPSGVCGQLLHEIYQAIKQADTNLEEYELSIGLARWKESRPVDGFDQSIILVPILIVGNYRGINPFVNASVAGTFLAPLKSSSWIICQPYIEQGIQQRISFFDLTSVAAYIGIDTESVNECPSKLSNDYNSRCLGLLNYLEYLGTANFPPPSYPPSYMAKAEGVYIRKRVSAEIDERSLDWVGIIGGTITAETRNGRVIFNVIVVSAPTLYNYLTEIGERTCTIGTRLPIDACPSGYQPYNSSGFPGPYGGFPGPNGGFSAANQEYRIAASNQAVANQDYRIAQFDQAAASQAAFNGNYGLAAADQFASNQAYRAANYDQAAANQADAIGNFDQAAFSQGYPNGFPGGFPQGAFPQGQSITVGGQNCFTDSQGTLVCMGSGASFQG